MRHGATLLELLAALAILAILAAVAVPAAGLARDRALVALTARHLASAHTDTRTVARLQGARAELVITPTTYRQQRWSGTGFTPTWSRPGPASTGVALAGPNTPIVFDSRGYSLGVANRTYRLSRGRASLRVVISRLGRLRILP
jgi:prepilin-type N-terminal cleavage/methylation domain-containing protein